MGKRPPPSVPTRLFASPSSMAISYFASPPHSVALIAGRSSSASLQPADRPLEHIASFYSCGGLSAPWTFPNPYGDAKSSDVGPLPLLFLFGLRFSPCLTQMRGPSPRLHAWWRHELRLEARDGIGFSFGLCKSSRVSGVVNCVTGCCSLLTNSCTSSSPDPISR